jgi:hypothetical protein
MLELWGSRNSAAFGVADNPRPATKTALRIGRLVAAIFPD